MPIFTQLKVSIWLAFLIAVAILGAAIYWRGSHNATAKADLRVARETIKVEREALKITHTIDMRVNAEGIQTAKTAQEAASEIEALRTLRREAPVGHTEPIASVPVHELSADAARVLQLAREARAAALASGAKLQSEGAGAR